MIEKLEVFAVDRMKGRKMKIEKPHPYWPGERDFDCPKCGGPLADKTEREHCDCEEKEQVVCPHCGEKLTVEMAFRIEYKVTSNA